MKDWRQQRHGNDKLRQSFHPRARGCKIQRPGNTTSLAYTSTFGQQISKLISVYQHLLTSHVPRLPSTRKSRIFIFFHPPSWPGVVIGHEAETIHMRGQLSKLSLTKKRAGEDTRNTRVFIHSFTHSER